MLPTDPLDDDAASALRRDPTWVAAVVDHLGHRLGLGPGTPYPQGSAVVARYGDVVVKLFFPQDVAHAQTEAAILASLADRLPITTPALLDTGHEGAWPYVVMRALPGRELIDVWPTLRPEAQQDLAVQLGECLGVLHGLPLPTDPSVDHLDWPSWSTAQVAGATAQHRRGGVPADLLDQIAPFLATADVSEGPRGAALIHTEIMHDHLKVIDDGDRWRLVGLFDFEPAMVAPVDYEFASVGIFFSAGDPTILRAVLTAAGIDADDPALTRRLFALALIHRYANLAFWMDRTGRRSSSLDRLGGAWFGLSPGSDMLR